MVPSRAVLDAANLAASIWSGMGCADACCPSTLADCGFAAASAMESAVTGSGTGSLLRLPVQMAPYRFPPCFWWYRSLSLTFGRGAAAGTDSPVADHDSPSILAPTAQPVSTSSR